MSCKHGNHENACDFCDAEEAQYEAGRKAGLAEAAATPSPVPAEERVICESLGDLLMPKAQRDRILGAAPAEPASAELPPTIDTPAFRALFRNLISPDGEVWAAIVPYIDTKLRAALASRPAPVAEQKPVAWRIRPYDHVEQQHSDVWTLTRDPDVAAIYRSKKAIIEPLVVAAAPSQPDQSAQEVIPQSEVFAYAAKEVEKDLSGAVEIMKGGAA